MWAEGVCEKRRGSLRIWQESVSRAVAWAWLYTHEGAWTRGPVMEDHQQRRPSRRADVSAVLTSNVPLPGRYVSTARRNEHRLTHKWVPRT